MNDQTTQVPGTSKKKIPVWLWIVGAWVLLGIIVVLADNGEKPKVNNAQFGITTSQEAPAARTSPAVSVTPVKEKPKVEALKVNALILSRRFVESALKAPSTAKFPAIWDEGVFIIRAGDKYSVSAYVDAQNSFGAMLRTDYYCEMTYTGPDGWDFKLNKLVLGDKVIVDTSLPKSKAQ